MLPTKSIVVQHKPFISKHVLEEEWWTDVLHSYLSKHVVRHVRGCVYTHLVGIESIGVDTMPQQAAPLLFNATWLDI